jgi:hypothetical protein
MTSHMENSESPSERKKREAEFLTLKKMQDEQLQKEIRAMAELLIDIYLERREQESKNNGSTPAGSKESK